MSETKCTSWLGHRFEARYSVTNAALSHLIEHATSIESLPNSTIQSMQDRHYERDICVRCGFAVEKHIEISGEPSNV